MKQLYILIALLCISQDAFSSMHSPLKRSRMDMEEAEEQAILAPPIETQESFIHGFYEGQRELTIENLTELGFKQNNEEVLAKAYNDDSYAYFILNLCKSGFINPQAFLERHRKMLISINRRAVLNNAMAAYNLGFIYLYGICLEQNSHFGIEFTTKAANLGHYQAQHLLSTVYEKGELVKANPELAAHWNQAALNTLTSRFTNDGTGW